MVFYNLVMMNLKESLHCESNESSEDSDNYDSLNCPQSKLQADDSSVLQSDLRSLPMIFELFVASHWKIQRS